MIIYYHCNSDNALLLSFVCLVGGKKRMRFAEECVYNVCVCVL